MHQSYKRLLNANPKPRLSVSHFRDQGRRSGGFFETPLIRLSEGIENLGLKSDGEREEFLRSVTEKRALFEDANSSLASLMQFQKIFQKSSLVSKFCPNFSSRLNLEAEDQKSLLR